MRFKIYCFTLLLLCFSGLNFVGRTYAVLKTANNNEPLIVAVDSTYENYFVQRGEPLGYQLELLKRYSTQLGTSFQIIVADNTEKQLELLRNNLVDFIVFSQGADSLSSMLANNVDLCSSIVLDDRKNSVWIVHTGNEQRISSINLWAGEFSSSQEYRFMNVKYFDRSLAKKSGSMLSPYDHWFKKYSEQIGWDWRLLAALTYQESKFNPTLTSRRGAFGLMQLMPNTAASLNIKDIELPENNIKAGVKLLGSIKKHVEKYAGEKMSEEDILKFTLSSYNAGIGRIADCRNFAESLGYNPNVWEHVKLVIPLMNEPEHYKGDNITLGKFKGGETINFVDEVLTRYQHYVNLVPDVG